MLYSRDDSGENFSVVKRRGSHIGGSENGGTTVFGHNLFLNFKDTVFYLSLPGESLHFQR